MSLQAERGACRAPKQHALNHWITKNRSQRENQKLGTPFFSSLLEIHAFDYLLKPFDRARFSKVLADAKRETEKGRQNELQVRLRQLLEEVQSPRNPRLLVEENGRGILIALNLIDWAEADHNYLKLHIGAHTYTVRGTIEGIEKKLDSEQFLRINRSSLIRIDFIRELQKWTHGEYRIIMRSGHTLMWTRRYLDRHSELLRKV